MSKIIGIDLGTSNSAAAVLEGGRPVLIPSAEGASLYGKSFPSVVAITKDGQILVGEPAKRQAVSNPENTVTAFKRKMGTNYKYKLGGKEFTPQELSAMVLRKIKQDAEAFLGQPVTKAVITVPAYFNDNQRQATKDAGQIAGLEVVRIINEPTAAALAYGLDKKGQIQKIMVFDLGGGTLDVTIMEFGEGVFEVKSTSGDTQLGGTDMDNAIVDYLVGIFLRETGINVQNDPVAMQRLKEAAEKAKIELSTTLESEINLPYLSADASGPKHFVHKLSRAKLEEIVDPIIQRCKKPMERALADAKLSPEQIDKVILVGGPTRMPIVQRFVESIIGKKVERGIDPMECVAFGAAIQGGVLAGEVKDVLLLDVTPLSLGIETLGGVFTKIIERNTTIPTRKSQVFTTAADNQTSVEIRVLQGERPMANDNVELGRFQLIGIPPAPRGVPQIEVTFDIDANGILHVSAKDRATGKEQKMIITAPNKMSKDEIEKKIKEAEQYAEIDKKKKEEAEILNEADITAYQSEKTLQEYKDKISASLREQIEKTIKDLREASAKKDIVSCKRLLAEIKPLLSQIGQEIYKSAGGQYYSADQGQPKDDEDKKGGDDTIDASYTKKS
ncbi:MAG: molecular chaperone DnaK [Candidatus Micrarchaeota archaeon]|nr:molecular chaperone DnaK [Candidatus Micrarchaeota archaeon]